MAPKHALLSWAGGLNFKDDPCSSFPTAAAAWIHSSGSRSRRRAQMEDGMLARRTAAVCAVLMLVMQGSSAAQADQGRQESMRLVMPLEQKVPSNLSDALGTGDKPVMDEADSQLKVFSEAKAAVWTETEEAVRTGPDKKVIAESGTLTSASAWTEVGAEWRPVDAGLSRDSAAWLGGPHMDKV
ncbi:hypothetical protein WMY93_023946 [Mugilogobius chulae]|uniref:Uncharacterized protein n=1 Tax=Mugilogobius chulae TaxID=88201 RepID=A0AAW0NG87_9GOBI